MTKATKKPIDEGKEDRIDEAVEQTFPASDASSTTMAGVGGPEHAPSSREKPAKPKHAGGKERH
jgi:hypothetical protein